MRLPFIVLDQNALTRDDVLQPAIAEARRLNLRLMLTDATLIEIVEADKWNLDSDQFMRDWERFFQLESNQHLIPALRSAAHETRAAVQKFGEFVSLNFFLRGGKQRIYLRPNLNIDLDGSGANDEMGAYDSYYAEMSVLGSQVVTCYEVYRRTVKEHLFL